MGLIRSYTRLSDDELHEITIMASARDIADFVGGLRETDPTISTDIDKAYTLLDDTTAADLSRHEVWPMMRHWDDGAVEYLRQKFVIMAEFINLAAGFDNHVVLELV